MRRPDGFTLIELLFVLVVFVILLAIAVPAYNAYVTSARRSEGRNALMALLHTQENLRSVCPQYASSLGATTDCTAGQLAAVTTTENGYYLIAITAASDTGFTATATAQGQQQQRDKDCPQLSLAMTAGNLVLTPPSCWK
ncbi:MAG TPA: type IV pilin protein [Rhodocyclaceae bacterium]|nr:type IV pilin protein [Rhodocyclaceae bacterium]